MKINWGTALNIALVGLSEAAANGAEIGSADHQTAAVDALNAAAQGASSIITDPTQLAEAQASYKAAASLINLIFSFKKK